MPRVSPTLNKKPPDSCPGEALTDKTSQKRSSDFYRRAQRQKRVKEENNEWQRLTNADKLTDRERGQTNSERHAEVYSQEDGSEMTERQMERVQRVTNFTLCNLKMSNM